MPTDKVSGVVHRPAADLNHRRYFIPCRCGSRCGLTAETTPIADRLRDGERWCKRCAALAEL